MIGNWNIGGFIPTNIVTWDYTSKELILNCASFKKPDGSDPTEEIFQIMGKITSGYDNSSVLQAGTVLQAYLPEDVLVISDGFETFLGTVEDVIPVEDKWADEVIYYQIKIARFIPPKESLIAEELPDGDETTWDDDWEAGYEQYNGACDISSGSYGGSGSSGGVTPLDLHDYGIYQSSGTYEEVNVYRHEYMEGAEYDPRYGYLLPEGIRHTIPEDITGFTIVIDTPVHDNVFVTTDYVGQYTPVVGAFGEQIHENYWDENWEMNPEIKVNSNDFNFERRFDGYQRQEMYINNLEDDKLVVSVERKSPTQGLMRLNVDIPVSQTGDGSDIGSVLPDECIKRAGGSTTKPNAIVPTKTKEESNQWVSGGIGAGGGKYPYNPKLTGGGGNSSNYTVYTAGSKISGGMGG